MRVGQRGWSSFYGKINRYLPSLILAFCIWISTIASYHRLEQANIGVSHRLAKIMALSSLGLPYAVQQGWSSCLALPTLLLATSNFCIQGSNAAALHPRAVLADGVELRVLPIGEYVHCYISNVGISTDCIVVPSPMAPRTHPTTVTASLYTRRSQPSSPTTLTLSAIKKPETSKMLTTRATEVRQSLRSPTTARRVSTRPRTLSSSI